MKSLILPLAAFALTSCAYDKYRATPNPYLSKDERQIISAVIMAGEEGGYGAAKMGITNYSYRVAKAIGEGYMYPKLILPVLIASNHTDACAAEMQTQILGITLLCSGDSAFATALSTVDSESRIASSSLLFRNVFHGRSSSFSVSLDPSNYPKTFEIVRNTQN
jgi:hypothetical protein